MSTGKSFGRRYVVVYHHENGLVHAHPERGLDDALRAAEKLNAGDKGAGGRYAVHELGPEVGSGGAA